jgi:hypothetical protein
MNFSAHAAAVIGYFPFIVALPALVAVICNHIDAAKRHPKIVYSSCGLLALCFSFLFSIPLTAGHPSGRIDCGIAGVLAALCFVVSYMRVTNVITKSDAALLWREIFLVIFAGLNLYWFWGNWKYWGSGLIVVLCAASAVLLWRSSPLSKYLLYAITLLWVVSALVSGTYNYVQNPALLRSPIKLQIIGWLVPGIPSALLISCCLYARRIGRGERKMVGAGDDG